MPTKDRAIFNAVNIDREPRPKKGGRTKTKWERRKIVAWDGEGANLADGRHVYNLLANSEGTMIYKAGGLSTVQVLTFFLKHGDPKAINVIFGGSYDVNMFLEDLPYDKLLTLYKEGEVYWERYKLTYRPRKEFTVHLYGPDGSGGIGVIASFTLWDVLGFFTGNFVNSCKQWLGDLPILDEIASMKKERDTFTEDMKDEIVAYNRVECALLVQLMEALFSAMDSADISLTRYDGAGSVASSLLRVNKIKEHMGEPNNDVVFWARTAYSGGRIEAPKIGNEIRPIYRYDINSAYPSSCLDLPSYKDATWTFDKEWDGQDCSLVEIEWLILEDKPEPFYPLWYRDDLGRILYPYEGHGIYYGVEVRNLLDYYKQDINYYIHGACNVHLADDTKPFSFIDGMYKHRLRLKKSGNMAHEALKLGMNSVYGKLCQQTGYNETRGIPPYHQLLWAGQITATTRAKLYRAAMQQPESVIAFATDAIFSTTPLDLPCSDKLGEWTLDEFTGITIVQPGVYFLQKDNEWKDKYRGFDRGSLLREHIVGSWLLGQDFEANLTRFITLGTAVKSEDNYNNRWRTWEGQIKKLTLTPQGKRWPSKDVCYWDHLCATVAAMNDLGTIPSYPYQLLWDDQGRPNESLRARSEFDEIEAEIADTLN